MTVVVSRSAIPSVDAINQELVRLELPCILNSGDSLESATGAINATVTSTAQTRSIQFEDSNWLDEEPELRERAGDRDRCMDFLLGSDMVECALVSAIATALSSLADAIVYYQPDGLFYTTEESREETLSALKPPRRR